jgi:acetyl-CoA carboxylase carboxyltransferase component
VLANLSGFDGSPESMRRGILELGAEIARAVVRFRGPLLFTVVSRYHGGAYVVFSRELNPAMRANALAGSFASVIGGPAAAAVVFPRDVRRRANEDPRVRELARQAAAASDVGSRVARRAELERVRAQVLLEKRTEVAAEFDAIHSVERALRVGSLESILEPRRLRPSLIELLGR